jgi:hypothetical protein
LIYKSREKKKKLDAILFPYKKENFKSLEALPPGINWEKELFSTRNCALIAKKKKKKLHQYSNANVDHFLEQV